MRQIIVLCTNRTLSKNLGSLPACGIGIRVHLFTLEEAMKAQMGRKGKALRFR